MTIQTLKETLLETKKILEEHYNIAGMHGEQDIIDITASRIEITNRLLTEVSSYENGMITEEFLKELINTVLSKEEQAELLEIKRFIKLNLMKQQEDLETHITTLDTLRW